MKRYEMFWNDREARARTDGKWVRYDDARAVIHGLQALLNERDAEIDGMREALSAAVRPLESRLASVAGHIPFTDHPEAYHAEAGKLRRLIARITCEFKVRPA